MHILNFSHPLNDDQLAHIYTVAGVDDIPITSVRTQFELEQPFAQQVTQLVDGLDITSDQWQTEGWIVVLPSLNYIAAVLLAELHGRMGRFPAMLRLKPVTGAIATTYEFAEIVNLETVRQTARTTR